MKTVRYGNKNHGPFEAVVEDRHAEAFAKEVGGKIIKPRHSADSANDNNQFKGQELGSN